MPDHQSKAPRALSQAVIIAKKTCFQHEARLRSNSGARTTAAVHAELPPRSPTAVGFKLRYLDTRPTWKTRNHWQYRLETIILDRTPAVGHPKHSCTSFELLRR